MEVDPLLHVFFFSPCWEDTVKKVQGEDQCKNHHIILAITTLVPLNSLISDSNSEDQITEIQPTAYRQSIRSSSSEQAVKVIGYKRNNETTVKISNASIRTSTRTKYSICIR